jgi:hypothetical protein
MNAEKRNWWGVAGYLFLASLAIVGIAAIVAVAMGWLKAWHVWRPEIALTLVLIAGVGGLLILLSFVVAVFAALNLSRGTHSLGLPEGSVRAVIALSLILIFAIQAVYLYGDLGGIEISTGITQTQLDAIPKEQIASIQPREVDGKTVFDVKHRVEKSEASVDFAKQILTTVSTLVVAVAGFYFGTRAVTAARGTEAPLLPVIRKIVPNHGEQEEEPSVEIFGKNFESPATVKLVQDSTEILGTDITWSTTKIKCKFKIPKDAAAKKWDLVVMNEDGGEDRLAEAFEVKQKSQAAE